MTRCDPAVLGAVRKWLPREPEPPMTGRELRNICISMAVIGTDGAPSHRTHLRRIGEAVRALREEGMMIDSSSRGYLVVTDAARIAKWQERETRRAKAVLYIIGRRKRLTDTEIDDIIRQIPLFQENCQ